VLDTDIHLAGINHNTGNCIVAFTKWDRLSVCARAVSNAKDFGMV
jgi:hypothetical protein